METKKIMFVCQTSSHNAHRPFGQGGTDSQIYGLASALFRKGHEISIIGNFIDPLWKDPSIEIQNLKFINVPSPEFPDERFGDLISGLMLSKKISIMIEKERPDLIILPAPVTGFFPSKLDIPFIYVTHNPNGMYFYKNFLLENHPLNFFSFPILHGLEEQIMHRAIAIFALNAYIESYLHMQGFSNIYQIPNGVNFTDYYSNQDKNYILYAGGFRRVKGIEYLIFAFSKIADHYDTDLLLIGSGKEKDNLKKQVSSLNLENRVHFIPLVDKVTLRRYLAECAVFILPSLFETFGVTLLEAMASGRTVIASDIPGPQDIITHGHDGFLFEKGNVEQLVEYLDLCLSNKNLRERLGKNARKTIEQKFSFNTIANEYLEIYDSIIRK